MGLVPGPVATRHICLIWSDNLCSRSHLLDHSLLGLRLRRTVAVAAVVHLSKIENSRLSFARPRPLPTVNSRLVTGLLGKRYFSGPKSKLGNWNLEGLLANPSQTADECYIQSSIPDSPQMSQLVSLYVPGTQSHRTVKK